jgi:type I restriction enzyme S subunit
MTDWPIKTLGDVCEVIAGQSPEGEFYNKEGRGVPFYQGKKDFAERFLGSPTTWTTEITKLARPGDILMSVRAPVGPVNLCPIEACIGRGLAAIRPSSKTGTDFIYYFLESIQSEIAGTEGAVFASINKAQIANLRCPVPPLEEQKRIVELLDAATARVTELTMCYEKARTHATSLFASALEDALEGNADSPVKNLGNLFDFQNGRGFKKTEWAKSGFPIIRIQNLNSESAPYNYFTGTFDQRILVESGDLLFSWSGSIGTSFGPHIWQRSAGLLNQHIFKVIPKVPIDTSYAHYCLRLITAEIERSVNGAVGLVHITKEKLNKFEIPVPSMEEQKRIVARLDSMRAKTSEMVAAYDAKLQAAKDLRQSVLEAAFAGEL